MVKKWKIIVCCVVAFLVLSAGVFGIYVGTYRHANEWAKQCLVSDDTVAIETANTGNIVFAPKRGTTKGLIFYPGDKIEYTSYAPLLRFCAEVGLFCVLVRTPCNIASFGVDVADGIREQYPSITSWYIGGHAEGGTIAAKYVSKHLNEFEGLFLFAAYSKTDLSGSSLSVLSVYGSEDKIMSKKKYDKYRSNLPSNSIEKVIAGGCHSYFGSYGRQNSDGKPTISCQDQLVATADILIAYLYNVE